MHMANRKRTPCFSTCIVYTLICHHTILNGVAVRTTMALHSIDALWHIYAIYVY